MHCISSACLHAAEPASSAANYAYSRKLLMISAACIHTELLVAATAANLAQCLFTLSCLLQQLQQILRNAYPH